MANGVIYSEEKIKQIAITGFECLGNHSPFFYDNDVVFTRRLSIDKQSVMWFAYSLSENMGDINMKNGEYLISPFAKTLFSAHCTSDGFFQINPYNKMFNHLAAVELYKSYTDSQ